MLFGVFFAMIIYYFDSIWLACAIHSAWNYSQNIILGLPNSGQAATKSVFEVVSSQNNFFYNTTFGIEGSVLTVIILAISCLSLYLLYGKKKNNH